MGGQISICHAYQPVNLASRWLHLVTLQVGELSQLQLDTQGFHVHVTRGCQSMNLVLADLLSSKRIRKNLPGDGVSLLAHYDQL
jgi:hypothetical protein